MLGFLDPSEMTPEERMDELARILADGFLRLQLHRGLLQHHPPARGDRKQDGLAQNGEKAESITPTAKAGESGARAASPSSSAV
jgi:hypothetical protein